MLSVHPQHVAARRAARAGLTTDARERQPVDADVQEAADGTARAARGHDEHEGVDAHRQSNGARRASGQARFRRDSDTWPVSGSSTYGTPVGSTGMPGRITCAARSVQCRTAPAGQRPDDESPRAGRSDRAPELRQAPLRRAPQPRLVGLQICCHRKRAARRSSCAQHRRRERLQPVRRAGLRGGALKPVAAAAGVAQVPVVHEGDVVEVLPLVRLSGDALLRAARSPDRDGPGRRAALRSGRWRRTCTRS